MKQKPVEKYRIIRDLPNEFFRGECPSFQFDIKAGETCNYFAHSDVYCFDSRNNIVPSISRRIVEIWKGQYFEPIDTGAPQ